MWLLVKRSRQRILVFFLQFTYFVCEFFFVFVHGRGFQVPDGPTVERWGYRSAHWEGWQRLTKARWLSVTGPTRFAISTDCRAAVGSERSGGQPSPCEPHWPRPKSSALGAMAGRVHRQPERPKARSCKFPRSPILGNHQ